MSYSENMISNLIDAGLQEELELQKTADEIAGIMYKLSDSDDDVTWLPSDKFHDAAMKILLFISKPNSK